ncbi:hypothetical protein J437_LFUL010922 [Ladona fulva]|uniref:Uncharacterized protein n=1 Tax=Ladona fulva TaxID=123851 RepID=A0A8K0KEU5_LADFU|nr:hypothetical protein J437_LFUL010922 [Ladona fulva]
MVPKSPGKNHPRLRLSYRKELRGLVGSLFWFFTKLLQATDENGPVLRQDV